MPVELADARDAVPGRVRGRRRRDRRRAEGRRVRRGSGARRRRVADRDACAAASSRAPTTGRAPATSSSAPAGRPRRRRLPLRAEADRHVPRAVDRARRREARLRREPPRPLVRPLTGSRSSSRPSSPSRSPPRSTRCSPSRRRARARGGRPGSTSRSSRSAYGVGSRPAAEHPRCRARVVEPGDPGQHERDEQRPPRHARSPDAGGGQAADGGGDRLGPRLQLAEVAGGDHDAALDRRLAEAGDEELARHDRGDHPRRERRPGRSARSASPARAACRPRVEQRAE